MDSVYENCVLCISATLSADGNGGCFTTFPEEPWMEIFEITTAGLNGQPQVMNVRRSLGHSLHKSSVPVTRSYLENSNDEGCAPLATRA